MFVLLKLVEHRTLKRRTQDRIPVLSNFFHQFPMMYVVSQRFVCPLFVTCLSRLLRCVVHSSCGTHKPNLISVIWKTAFLSPMYCLSCPVLSSVPVLSCPLHGVVGERGRRSTRRRWVNQDIDNLLININCSNARFHVIDSCCALFYESRAFL